MQTLTPEPVIVQHLREARAELLRRRLLIDAALIEIDLLIAKRTKKGPRWT